MYQSRLNVVNFAVQRFAHAAHCLEFSLAETCVALHRSIVRALHHHVYAAAAAGIQRTAAESLKRSLVLSLSPSCVRLRHTWLTDEPRTTTRTASRGLAMVILAPAYAAVGYASEL